MNPMLRTVTLLTAVSLFTVAGCGESGGEGDTTDTMNGDASHEDDQGHNGDQAHENGMEEHAHEEEPLGTAMIGDWEVEFAQGHGPVEPGKECHLIVKLPYSDDGETQVRAWIGTEDRTKSMVGLGEYAPSHDDYDLHATAPDPLPENAQWWVEVDPPDSEPVVGSIDPLME